MSPGNRTPTGIQSLDEGTKTPESIDKRREGALKAVLAFSPKSGLAVECAKIEALFLIAELLAELNAKLDLQRRDREFEKRSDG